MAVFEVQGPDGGIYEVEANDEAHALMAFKTAPSPAPAASTTAAPAVSPAEYAADVLRKFKQGASLGFGDEISGALKATLGGQGAEGGTWTERYQSARDYERRMQDKASRDAPVGSAVAEIAGSIAPSMVAGELAGLIGAARAGLPAVRAAALPATRSAASGMGEAMKTGAVVGSVQGVGDTEDMMQAPLGALRGAVVGAGGGAAGYGAGKLLEGAARLTNTAPRVAQAASTEDLKSAAQEAYDRFTNAGGLFTQQGLNDLRGNIQTRLTDMGWQPELGPKVVGFNRAMQRATTGSGVPSGTAGLQQTATPQQIQNLRRIAGQVRSSNDPAERRYGAAIIEEIDGFLGNVKPGQYAAPDGAPLSIGDDLAEGNRLWSQYSKADAVDEAFQKAERRAASTYSGGNENNAIRQELRRTYEKMLKTGGLSDDEKAAFETAIRGGRLENVARMVGKLAPSRGGLSTWANIGTGAATGGATLPLSAMAEGMKLLGDRATRRNLEEVSRVIRAGGSRRSVSPSPNALQRAATRLPAMLAGPGGAFAVRGLLD